MTQSGRFGATYYMRMKSDSTYMENIRYVADIYTRVKRLRSSHLRRMAMNFQENTPVGIFCLRDTGTLSKTGLDEKNKRCRKHEYFPPS